MSSAVLPAALLTLASFGCSLAALSGTPGGVPLSTDCLLRAQVWDFGVSLLSSRKGNFPELHDALELGRCAAFGVRERPNTTVAWRHPSKIPLQSGQQNRLTIFADAVHGDDEHGQGTMAAPLQSIEKVSSLPIPHDGFSSTQTSR